MNPTTTTPITTISSSSTTVNNVHHSSNHSAGSGGNIGSGGGSGNNVLPFLMNNSNNTNNNPNNGNNKNGQGVVVTNSGQFHSLSSINSIHLTQNLPQQTFNSPRINSTLREPQQATAFHTSTVFSPASVINTEKTHDDTSSIFNGSASSTVISKSAFNSMVNKAKNHFMSFTLFMQDNEKKQNKMERIMMFMMYMYMIWVGIWISTLSPYDYHFGEWGSWFFAVVLYPATFSIERVNYDGSIALLFISVLCAFFGLGMYVFSFRAMLATSRFMNQIKKTVLMIARVVVFLSCPMSFSMSTFIDCKWINMDGFSQTSSTRMILNRFNTYYMEERNCYTSTNIAFLVIFLCTHFLLTMICAFSTTVLSNSHPLSKTVFVADASFVPALMFMSNLMEILFHFIIPSNYAFVRSIIHMLMAFFFILFLFKNITYMKRVDNSIISGFGFAKFGASLGTLISFFVNKDNINNTQNYNTYGIVMTGVTIGLVVFGFIIGFIVMEIYTRYIVYTIRQILENVVVIADRSQYYEQSNDDLDMQDNQESQIIIYEKIIEREAPLLYHKMESEKRMKFLVYYLNFCMHRNVDELMANTHPSTHKKVPKIESIGMTDTHAALCFIKGLFGGSTAIVNNVGLMLTCSSLVAYYWPTTAESVNTTVFANSLLRKALKKQPTFIQRFLIGIKIKEIEVNADEKTRLLFEAKHLVAKLERRQQELKALHRNFWKELTHEVVNYEKIESIILRASDLSSKCETQYENLRLTYKHDKSLLRSHAQFLETCRFDPDIAHEMYNEASQMEEEETANHAMKTKNNLMATVNIAERRKMWREQAKSRANNRGGGGNVKVVPVNGNKELARGDSTSSIEGKDTQEEYGHHFEMVDPRSSLSFSDQMPFDGVENQGTLRKETVFKNSLSVPHRHTFQLGGFIIFLVLSVCLLVVSSVLSGTLSYEVTDDLEIVKAGCIPTSSGVQMISKLRSLKFVNSFYCQRAWPLAMTSLGFKNLTDYNTKIWKDIDQYHSYFVVLRDMSMKERVFTPTMYNEFHERYYPMLTPEVYPGSDVVFYNSTRMVNISIADITNLVIKYSEDLMKNRDMDQTFSNYGFMFFYDNHDYMTKAYSEFCSILINESKYEAYEVDIAYMSFLIVALVIYILFGTGYIIYTHISLKFVRSQIKLIEREVSKNIAGRLFHDLEKKVNDDVTVRLPKSKLLRPKNVIIMLSISLMILMAICAGILYFGNRYNAEKIGSSYISFRHATNSMFYVQRVAFAVTEQFTNKLPHVMSDSLQSDDDINLLNQELEENIQNLRDNWNLCLYGSSKELYSSNMNRGILGMFSEVDQLIIGESNCTFSQFRSTTNGSSTCFLSLNSLLTDYMALSTQFNSMLKLKNFNTSDTTIIDDYIQTIFLSNMITMDVIGFTTIITDNYSTPAFEILISFSVIGSVSILLFSYLIYIYLTKYWDSIQEMRLYFNYVSVDTLDSNEALRNYCIHHLVNDTFLLKRKYVNNTSLQDSKVRSLLNASVDGAVMCSGQTCDIDIFNPAAQRMFGYNQTETVGRPLFDLFDSLSQQSIKKSVSDMLQEASEAQSKGDSLDAECVRKNQTTFPARANIFVTKHDNKPIITIFIKDITSEKKHLALIAEEKKHSEELLLNILPHAVASKLKSGETFIAEKFSDITCFFSDMVNFTRLSSDMNPSELVLMLNSIVNGFDELITKYNLEKIKTIGDAYFAVGGLHGLNAQSDHPERTLKFAIDTYQVVSSYNSKSGKPMKEQINIRIGMHTGSVVAGVIGKLKFAYDLWGDTINMASRMESNSINGRIQISRTTYERVYDLGFSFEERTINVKGKGETLAYLLDSKHHVSAIVNHEETTEDTELESIALPPKDTLEVIPLRESMSNQTDLVDLTPSTP